MKLDEHVITKAIIDTYYKKLMNNLEVDVAVVGGGPAGLVCGYCLAERGCKVALFERKLSIGGGMWGGGMLFNEIVVQADGREVLDRFGVATSEFEPGYYTADSIETVSTIMSRASKAGVTMFNGISVEDVIVRESRVCGLVINWTPIESAGMHVDPLCIRTQYIVEATGHPIEVIKVIQEKTDLKLKTPTGKAMGERSMWADAAEKSTLENTREAFPGVYVAGMAANATFGSFRMGPIFGGMLLSGEKAAQLIAQRLDR
jgi:thiamine thiazole synthase